MRVHTLSGQFDLENLASAFPLYWSHYVRLLSLRDEHARRFYETEALRGGGSLRQLDRQINSLFYYVNYAAEHLPLPEENPPVGLILCSEPDAAVARYALSGLVNQVMAAEYRTALPDPAELAETRRMLESPTRRKEENDCPLLGGAPLLFRPRQGVRFSVLGPPSFCGEKGRD